MVKDENMNIQKVKSMTIKEFIEYYFKGTDFRLYENLNDGMICILYEDLYNIEETKEEIEKRIREIEDLEE